MQTEPIKNHQYVSHNLYPNTCAVCEKTPFHENHSLFRKYGDLTDFLKSEAKEKAYEPPFPYETQEERVGDLVIERNRLLYEKGFTVVVETDTRVSAEPILRELMKHVDVAAIYNAMHTIEKDLGRMREAAVSSGLNSLKFMGIPIVVDPTMEPGTWKLVVSKLPTQMCEINR